MNAMIHKVAAALNAGFTAFATMGQSSVDRIQARAAVPPAEAIRQQWIAVGQQLSSTMRTFSAVHEQTQQAR